MTIAKIYCFWGQSNIIGWRSDNALAPIVSDQILYNNTSKLDIGLHPLKALKTIAKKESKNNNFNFGFGPEMQFSTNLDTTDINTKHIVLKHGAGGTNMFFWTVNNGSSGSTTDRSKEILRAINQLENIKAQCLLNGWEPQIEGIFWLQGESDARDINFANGYQNNLTALVGGVRDYLEFQTLKWFLAKPVNTAFYINKVRNAINTINLPNVYKLDTISFLRDPDDNEHLTTQGQIQLGQGFFDLYNQVKSK
jgi:hypothetical protein